MDSEAIGIAFHSPLNVLYQFLQFHRSFIAKWIFLQALLYLVLVAVLVENVGDVLAVLPDGDEALLHVEGAAGRQDQVQSCNTNSINTYTLRRKSSCRYEDGRHSGP